MSEYKYMPNYQSIVDAIEELHESLEEDNPHFINAVCVDASVEFAKFLRDNDIPVPRIFSHGGDSLCFVWENPKRYCQCDTNKRGVVYYFRFVHNKAGQIEELDYKIDPNKLVNKLRGEEI